MTLLRIHIDSPVVRYDSSVDPICVLSHSGHPQSALPDDEIINNNVSKQ